MNDSLMTLDKTGLYMLGNIRASEIKLDSDGKWYTRVLPGEGITQVADRLYTEGYTSTWKRLSAHNGWPTNDSQLYNWTGPMLRPGMIVYVPHESEKSDNSMLVIAGIILAAVLLPKIFRG